MTSLIWDGGQFPLEETTPVRDSREAVDLRQQMKDRFIQAAIDQYREVLGTSFDNNWWNQPYYRANVMGGMEDVLAAPTAQPDHSTTNVQENGVDEADLIETDGQFIYVVSGTELTIVEAGDSGSLSVVSHTEMVGNVFGQFLNGDKLTVISAWTDPGSSGAFGWGGWYSWSNRTAVTVYDVSDRTVPRILEQTVVSGNYQTARQIGDTVFLVMSDYAAAAPSPSIAWDYSQDTKHDFVDVIEVDPTYGPVESLGNEELIEITDDGLVGEEPMLVVADFDPIMGRGFWGGGWGWGGGTGTYETEAEYRESLNAYYDSVELPQFYTVSLDGLTPQLDGQGLIVDPEFYLDAATGGLSFTTILAINTADSVATVDDQASAAGYYNSYFSPTSAYLFGNAQSADGNWSWDSTDITRYALDGADIELASSGCVEGRVINSFALDEQDGLLRIATTVGGWWGDSSSSLTILDEVEGRLETVAALTDIAPGESIYAVRFLDSRAYVVTFQQTDPLFVIDLSDGRNPVLLGELVVPGFSQYLQPLDENHVVGIGRDANFGMQVSLFDVTDPTSPVLDDTYSFSSGEGWDWSAASWDHHAFSLFPESGTLVVPVDSWSPTDSGEDDFGARWNGNWQHTSRFEVLTVDTETGLDYSGSVEHDSTALRSLRIGNVLYALSERSISSHPIDQPSETLSQVELYEAGVMILDRISQHVEWNGRQVEERLAAAAAGDVNGPVDTGAGEGFVYEEVLLADLVTETEASGSRLASPDSPFWWVDSGWDGSDWEDVEDFAEEGSDEEGSGDASFAQIAALPAGRLSRPGWDGGSDFEVVGDELPAGKEVWIDEIVEEDGDYSEDDFYDDSEEATDLVFEDDLLFELL